MIFQHIPEFPRKYGKFDQFTELTFQILKIQHRDWREKIPIKFPAKNYQGREINLPDEYQKPSEAAWG